MALTHFDIRKRFKLFYETNGHKEVPAIPLVPQNDPTTLFTGSGMQQFVPNLLGESHPQGKELYNIQRCFRASDIEEIGDNRHTTFFEMIGNWSLGTYFKKEQLSCLFSFLIDEKDGLGLDPNKLFVTVFIGNDQIPRDTESIEVWKQLFASVGIKTETEKRIFMYDATKNWWSRAGTPSDMPTGEPGGPDSEVFFDFGPQLKLHETSPFREQVCHPNCDCGRYMEIANSVFMQYLKQGDGSFKELPQKNVDFGGGMERFAAAINDNPDVFATDLFAQIIKTVESITGKQYGNDDAKKSMRIIADHLKVATFLIVDGVRPSNKEQGYVLRRLLRRSAVKMKGLTGSHASPSDFGTICNSVIDTYGDIYFQPDRDRSLILPVIEEEITRFSKSLDQGLKEVQKIKHIDGIAAFNLYQSYGFPLEITEELFKERGQKIDRKVFYQEFQKHKDLSRTASAGKFKGGLADHSEQTVKYHTATHLLHQALFDVLGSDVRQEGSNITADRLRFDFYSLKKPGEEELKKIEKIVNDKIKESLPVFFKIIPKTEALNIGARSFFREKYPDLVKVYFMGDYSKEFCGGPHVQNTKEIDTIHLYKFEKIGSNLYRMYAR